MVIQRRSHAVALVCATVTVLGGVSASTPGDSQVGARTAARGMEVLHGAHVMRVYGARHQHRGGLLSYHGGDVQTAPMVFLVYWGSQWNSNDPSGEAALQQSFFHGVGGSSWNNSVTQYCEAFPVGTTQRGSSGIQAGNQAGVLAGVWFDNGSAAPSSPTQSQIAAEAVRAASHFNVGVTANLQFVVNTATGNNSGGFGTQYCAYHGSGSSTSGEIAYTYMPYITDAGASRGANFNGLGPKAGITIVGGHEFAESETDPFPASGWVDGSGGGNRV